MPIKLLEGETVLKTGKANRFTCINSQGGELTLTNQRLIFVGHGFNIGHDSVVIPLSEVMQVRPACTLTCYLLIPIPNAVRVVTNDGRGYGFTVWGRGEWVQQIAANLPSAPGAPAPHGPITPPAPVTSALPSAPASIDSPPDAATVELSPAPILATSASGAALMPCTTCGREIAIAAPRCPHCGMVRKRGGLRKPITIALGVGFALFVLLVIIGMVAGDPDANEAAGPVVEATSDVASDDAMTAPANTVREAPAPAPAPSAATERVHPRESEAARAQRHQEATERIIARARWNTHDLDITSNGNLQTAVRVIDELKALDEAVLMAQTDVAARALRAPWQYYGQLLEISGEVSDVQSFPPGSPASQMLGGGEVSEIVVYCADGTNASFLTRRDVDLDMEDWVTLSGFPIGRIETENRFGGTGNMLVLVEY